MLNQVALVGRLSNDIEIKGNKNELDIVLAVTRRFKNSNGIYETDFINCKVYFDITNNVSECCKKGDVIGIRGHLQVVDNVLVVIADKISFLTSKGAKYNE